MIAEEANAFLTAAAVLDPRLKRLDVMEQVAHAEGWATVLHDVSLQDALRALEQHYRTSREAIMPADVLRLLQVDVAPSTIPDLTERIGRAIALERAGLTEAEAAALSPEELAARLTVGPPRELAAGWAVPVEVDDE